MVGYKYNTYELPDTGGYQLILGKGLFLINDFEYDTKAKDWMGWWYFKNFLEGGTLTVARPRNRGGNETFKGKAFVLMTALPKATLPYARWFRGMRRDNSDA